VIRRTGSIREARPIAGPLPDGKSWAGRGRACGLPPGVLDYVRQNGEDRITWQPRPGVRMASVVVGFGGVKSGFVLAARSLREIEKRGDQAELEAGLAWIAALGVSLILVALGAFLLRSDSRSK